MANYVDDYEPEFECNKCGRQGENDELVVDEYEPRHFIWHCPECDSTNIWYNVQPEQPGVY